MSAWPGPHGIVQCSWYVPSLCGVNVTAVAFGMTIVFVIPRSPDAIPCTPSFEMKCNVVA